MLPLFKSHYSIGKSIITLNHPDKLTEGGSSSVFDIASNHKLEEVILVEDSLVGFLEAKNTAESLGIKLLFGLRISICDDMSKKTKNDHLEGSHKIVIFAKNSNGCILLNKIYSLAFTKGEGKIDFKTLKTIYNEQDLKIAIPFYDSFLYNNSFFYGEPCMFDFSFCNPTYFIEDNDLPIDFILNRIVSDHCVKHGFETQKTKTIYYENRNDFEAYQTYKCICNRNPGRAKTLDMPNLDHCGSPEFCFESYLENESA